MRHAPIHYLVAAIIALAPAAPASGLEDKLELMSQDVPEYGLARRVFDTLVARTSLKGWTHIAATLSGTTGKLYINGDLVGSNTNMNAPAGVNRTLNYIGRSNWSQDGYFAGDISDLRTWSVARTQDELLLNMYTPAFGGQYYQNLLARWSHLLYGSMLDLTGRGHPAEYKWN